MAVFVAVGASVSVAVALSVAVAVAVCGGVAVCVAVLVAVAVWVFVDVKVGVCVPPTHMSFWHAPPRMKTQEGSFSICAAHPLAFALSHFGALKQKQHPLFGCACASLTSTTDVNRTAKANVAPRGIPLATFPITVPP